MKLQGLWISVLSASIIAFFEIRPASWQIEALSHQDYTHLFIDTTKRIEVDNYLVTNAMFGTDVKQNGREIKSGEIYSGDMVWFTNKELNQTLVVELYTDGFRNAFFHFYNNDIPKGLIKEMELYTVEGEIAGTKTKVKYFSGFIRKAKPIKAKYFKSEKGFVLGDPKEKAIKIYGKPDKVTNSEGIARYEWDFEGDIANESKKSSRGKPLASESFGYQVIMFFRNNKIIGIILHNDIP